MIQPIIPSSECFRIGIVGGPGSGKRALARVIASQLNLPLLPPQSEEVFLLAGRSSSLPRIDWEILQRQAVVETALLEYVASGTVVDILTYASQPRHLVTSPDEFSEYEADVRELLGRYTHLIVLPEPGPGKPPNSYLLHKETVRTLYRMLHEREVDGLPPIPLHEAQGRTASLRAPNAIRFIFGLPPIGKEVPLDQEKTE